MPWGKGDDMLPYSIRDYSPMLSSHVIRFILLHLNAPNRTLDGLLSIGW